MLYFDNESFVTQHSFDESCSSTTDEGEKEYEEALEFHEDEEYRNEQIYFYLFDHEDGAFRRLFPSLYSEDSFLVRDLSVVLFERNFEDNNDENNENASEEPKNGFSVNQAVEQFSSSPPTPATHDAAFALTPALKFIDKNPGRSLLIAIDPQLNRKILREMHSAQYPGIDFYVGYIDTEPTGWALLFSTDETHIEAMQSLYTNHRFATEADRLMFCKKRNKSGKKKKSSTLS